MLTDRMIWVVVNPSEIIKENRQRLLEGHAMFPKVCARLGRIPDELHDPSLRHRHQATEDAAPSTFSPGERWGTPFECEVSR